MVLTETTPVVRKQQRGLRARWRLPYCWRPRTATCAEHAARPHFFRKRRLVLGWSPCPGATPFTRMSAPVRWRAGASCKQRVSTQHTASATNVEDGVDRVKTKRPLVFLAPATLPWRPAGSPTLTPEPHRSRFPAPHPTIPPVPAPVMNSALPTDRACRTRGCVATAFRLSSASYVPVRPLLRQALP